MIVELPGGVELLREAVRRGTLPWCTDSRYDVASRPRREPAVVGGVICRCGGGRTPNATRCCVWTGVARTRMDMCGRSTAIGDPGDASSR